jgi:hypothetical protein
LRITSQAMSGRGEFLAQLVQRPTIIVGDGNDVTHGATHPWQLPLQHHQLAVADQGGVSLSDNHRVNPDISPPLWFIAATMNFAMMPPTQGNGEFIARLASERPGLRKSQVVGVRRLSAAKWGRATTLTWPRSKFVAVLAPLILSDEYSFQTLISSVNWKRIPCAGFTWLAVTVGKRQMRVQRGVCCHEYSGCCDEVANISGIANWTHYLCIGWGQRLGKIGILV